MNSRTLRERIGGWQEWIDKVRPLLARRAAAISTGIAGSGSGKVEEKHTMAPDMIAALNIDEIAAQLSVDERARTDGKHELPPATEEVVGGTQKEIVVHFRQMQRRAQDTAARLAEKLHSLRTSIDEQEAAARLQDIPSMCQNEILRCTAETNSQLDLLRERQQQIEDLYNDRELRPDTRQGPSSLFRYGLVAVLTAALAVAAGDVIAPGAAGLTIVSVFWAILISLVFTLVPLLLGAATGYARKLSTPSKAVTTLLSAGSALLFVTAVALTAAHYVAAPSAITISNARDAMTLIIAAPAAAGTSIPAWTACSFVFVAGFLAFLTGFRSSISDRDGNGALLATRIQTRHKREMKARQMRKRINAIVDTGQREVTTLLDQLKTKVRTYSDLVDAAGRIPDNLSNYDIALEDACNILLDRYRAGNTKNRKSETPMSFCEHVCFRTDVQHLSSMIANEEKHLQAIRESIAELESQATAVRAQLWEMNRHAIGNGSAPPPLGSRSATLRPAPASDSESILPASQATSTSSVRSIEERASRRHGSI